MDEQTEKTVLGLLAELDCVSAARISASGELMQAQGFLSGILPAGDVTGAFRDPGWARIAAAGERIARQRELLVVGQRLRHARLEQRVLEQFAPEGEAPALTEARMRRIAATMSTGVRALMNSPRVLTVACHRSSIVDRLPLW